MIDSNLNSHIISLGMKMNKQQGVAVMITMFALLFVCSLIVLSSSKTIRTNTMVVRNQFYEDQAFEAAEAGIEYGLVHLKENRSDIVKDSNGDGFIDEYVVPEITNVYNSNGTTYTITYTNPIANNFDIIQLSVTGTADAGRVSRELTQLAVKIIFVQMNPPAGFITKDGVDLGGNVTIYNTDTGTTIWSGGVVGLTGAATTEGTNGVGSDRNNINTDIDQNDTRLSAMTGDEYFENFFGVDKTAMEDGVDILLNFNSSQNLNAILDPESNNGKAIWVNQNAGEAFFSGNATLGTPTEPVVLVIDGDFKANGTTVIYGVVYITKDWVNSGGGI